MPDFIADLFLAFSNRPIIFFILIIIGVLHGKELLIQSVCLVTLAIIVAIALKGTFKIPLPTHISASYAFPSGHMTLSTAFYVWLALFIPSWIVRVFVGILLTGIGISLMHYDYHIFFDVLAGLIVGMALAIGYYFLLRENFKNAPWILLLSGALLMGYNLLMYTNVPNDGWRAFFTFAGFILGERIYSKNGKKYAFWKLNKIK